MCINSGCCVGRVRVNVFQLAFMSGELSGRADDSPHWHGGMARSPTSQYERAEGGGGRGRGSAE